MLTYELETNTTDLNKLVEYLHSQFSKDHFYVENHHLFGTISPSELNKVFATIKHFEHEKEVL